MGNLINKLLLWLCTQVFEGIEGIYRLFYGLATTRLFSEKAIQEVSNNIYILVSIVILFAFAVKLIEAIVNPDLLTDSKKGVTGVLKRTIIGLVLVATVPSMFNLAYKIATEVISTSLVEKVILGYTEASTDSNSTAGVLTSSIIRGFIYPIDENGITIDENSLCGENSGCNFADELANYNMTYQNYISVIGANPNYEEFSDINVEAEWENGNKMYHMSLFFLLIVGIYVWYQVVILCFDAALRLVNLGILEIMAPLVIVAYMGGGTDYLSKWFKIVLEKFLSVFVRIAALAFLALGLRLMFDKESIFFNQSTTFLFRLLIIIGLLRLVKDLPNIIGKIFGVDIKDAGGIKGRLGEMAGIGGLASKAWGSLGTEAGKGLVKTAGHEAARNISELGKKTRRKLGMNEKSLAQRVGESRFGRRAKVLGAGIKSGGKNTGKAIEDARKELLKDVLQEEKNASKQATGKRMEKKYQQSVTNAVDFLNKNPNEMANVLDSKGNIVPSKLVNVARGSMQDYSVSKLNENILKNSSLSSKQYDNLKKYSDAKSALTDTQSLTDRRNQMKSMINGLKNNVQNPADQAKIDSIIKNIDNGKYSKIDDLKDEISSLSMVDKGVTSELLGNMIASVSNSEAKQNIAAVKARWDSGQITSAQDLKDALHEASTGKDGSVLVNEDGSDSISNELIGQVYTASVETSKNISQQYASQISDYAEGVLFDDTGKVYNSAELDYILQQNKEKFEKAQKGAEEMKDSLSGDAQEVYNKYYKQIDQNIVADKFIQDQEYNKTSEERMVEKAQKLREKRDTGGGLSQSEQQELSQLVNSIKAKQQERNSNNGGKQTP